MSRVPSGPASAAGVAAENIEERPPVAGTSCAGGSTGTMLANGPSRAARGVLVTNDGARVVCRVRGHVDVGTQRRSPEDATGACLESHLALLSSAVLSVSRGADEISGGSRGGRALPRQDRAEGFAAELCDEVTLSASPSRSSSSPRSSVSLRAPEWEETAGECTLT